MKMRMILLTVVAMVAVAPAAATVYSSESASREARFANPPASARILPIRHGRPDDKAKADAELATLKAQGFGGFAGNVNFSSNYLENAANWETLRHTLAKARDMGQTFWLYDEKGYPSCTAGGKTLEGHPEWAARAYLVAVTNVPVGSAALPPSPPGKPVATLRRTSADGKTDTVFVVTDDCILEGTHVSASVSTFKYRYPNLLMKEPTARFIELTHEAYRRELGADLLRTTTSTFTDEPSLMTLWMREMPYLCLPVSDELLDAYRTAAGHPLADDVPELVCGEPAGHVAAVRHRFWTMVAERVAKNYVGQLTDWATANGILSGGHLLNEEGFVAQVPLYGDFFKVLRAFSAPGCDVLTSVPAHVPWQTSMLPGSAAELNGARRVMSEASDHCERFRKPGDTRPVYAVSVREIVGSLNRQIWGGINTFTSYYRWQYFTDAEKRAINEEVGRTVTLMSEGRSAAEIALLYPADALMVGFEPRHHGAGGAAANRTANSFQSAGASLFRAARPFLVVDAASVAEAEVRDGRLVRGPLAWRTVILPRVNTLPIAAARRLAAFAQAGGLVIALGERPVNSERAFPDAELATLTKDWVTLDAGRDAFLLDLLAARIRPAAEVERGCPEPIRLAHRRGPEGDVFLVMNDSGEDWSGSLRLAGDPAVRIWNPRVGLSTEAKGEVALDLPSFGAVVLTAREKIEETMRAGGTLAFNPHAVPLAAKGEPNLGKGTFVKAKTVPLADGFTRIETELTKGGVDTFAFFHSNYKASPFPARARGVAYTVRIPEDSASSANIGLFVSDKDGNRWYRGADAGLGRKGTYEVFALFSSFGLHGAKPGARQTTLRPEDIRSVSIGFGGYYGRQGERIVFEASAPGTLEL